jgi:hypothetical protein
MWSRSQPQTHRGGNGSTCCALISFRGCQPPSLENHLNYIAYTFETRGAMVPFACSSQSTRRWQQIIKVLCRRLIGFESPTTLQTSRECGTTWMKRHCTIISQASPRPSLSVLAIYRIDMHGSGQNYLINYQDSWIWSIYLFICCCCYFSYTSSFPIVPEKPSPTRLLTKLQVLYKKRNYFP